MIYKHYRAAVYFVYPSLLFKSFGMILGEMDAFSPVRVGQQEQGHGRGVCFRGRRPELGGAAGEEGG